MVSTRRGDYSTQEKNPPRPLECSPASRPPRNKEDEAEEDGVISVAVDYATSFTFDDEQHANENNVAAGGRGNGDAGGDDRGMNDDNGGDNRGMNEDEGA